MIDVPSPLAGITLGLGLGVISLFAALIGLLTRNVGRRTGACANCGYCLTGLPTTTCPECGSSVEGAQTFRPWQSPSHTLIRLGIIGLLAGCVIVAIPFVTESISQHYLPDSVYSGERLDTTPPTLQVSFIAPHGDILSESPTEVRVKPGTKIIVSPWVEDDGGAGWISYFAFNGYKYQMLDQFVVPSEPGTYTAHGYARDAAGNETTIPFNIVIVADEEIYESDGE